eukprot:45359_1
MSNANKFKVSVYSGKQNKWVDGYIAEINYKKKLIHVILDAEHFGQMVKIGINSQHIKALPNQAVKAYDYRVLCPQCNSYYLQNSEETQCSQCQQNDASEPCVRCATLNRVYANICFRCHLKFYEEDKTPLNNNSIESWFLTWDGIANAIKHELYDKLAASFINCVNKCRKHHSLIKHKNKLVLCNKNIEFVLNVCKKNKTIKLNEIHFIRKLIYSRAMIFQPMTYSNITDDRLYCCDQVYDPMQIYIKCLSNHPLCKLQIHQKCSG